MGSFQNSLSRDSTSRPSESIAWGVALTSVFSTSCAGSWCEARLKALFWIFVIEVWDRSICSIQLSSDSMNPYFVGSPEWGPRAVVVNFDCTVECAEQLVKTINAGPQPRDSASFGLAWGFVNFRYSQGWEPPMRCSLVYPPLYVPQKLSVPLRRRKGRVPESRVFLAQYRHRRSQPGSPKHSLS